MLQYGKTKCTFAAVGTHGSCVWHSTNNSNRCGRTSRASLQCIPST